MVPIMARWLDGVSVCSRAAGVAAALRAGIDPASVRRPLADTATELRRSPAEAGAIIESALGEPGR